MKDVSFLKGYQDIPIEYSVNKIQDILWDDVFEQYFLHPKVKFDFSTYRFMNVLVTNSFVGYI